MSAGTHNAAMSGAARTFDGTGTRSFSAIQSHAGAGPVTVDRPWVRLISFTALGGYGVARWADLMRHPPGWRMAGLLALAVLLAGGVPVIAKRDRVIAAFAGGALVVLGLPMSGLNWQWFVHERVARSERLISHGLNVLPNVLVPYLGSSHAIRLVIVLGAAVLLLDAAAVLAFAGWGHGTLGDGRRAAAALPLIALAVVPATLIRPQFPYLQGLILFALLAAFMWGERVRRPAAAPAIGVLALAGIVAAFAAPRIDPRSPWFDYRSFNGTTITVTSVDRFDWSQTYGPLRWPHSGHEVMSVLARFPDYWKTENLDRFDGVGWAAGGIPAAPLPHVPKADAAHWIQTLRVAVEGMTTSTVIVAGQALSSSTVPGGVKPGASAGTWVARRPLGPGVAYTVRVYSPHPSAARLTADRASYPAGVTPYRGMALPQAGEPAGAYPVVTFPVFHTPGPIRFAAGLSRTSPAAALHASPYAPVYVLAHQLATTASTPYAFAVAVQRYLSHGFTYNQNPRPARYPLVDFLLHSRAGYCQQFAGTMALLLRMGGVPARVSTGFTTGVLNAATREYAVTDIEAHAWVEAWFPGYGWVRFDPTPISAPARTGISTNAPIVRGLSKQHGLTPSHRHEIGNGATAGALRGAAAGPGLPVWLIVIGVALLVLVALVVWAAVRWASVDHDPLSELERAMTRTRRPLAGGVTLVELEHRLETTPDAAEYVRRLRLARYAGQAVVPTAHQRRALRRELARGLGLRGALRALWALPPRPGPGHA